MGAMAHDEPPQDRSRRAGAKSRRSRPGAGVAVITVAALAVVGVLAVQADGSQVAGTPRQQSVHHPATPAKSGPTHSSAPSTAQPPADSGSGTRAVYSLSEHRVWLVNTTQQTTQSFIVVPGTVVPELGTHQVYDRIAGETGSDGLAVEYVVLFAKDTGGSAIGFDADAGITGLPGPPTHPTGGIRTTQADALAIWNFAPIGTAVVVVH